MSEENQLPSPPTPYGGRLLVHAALALALAAAALSAWQWLQGERHASALQQALTERLAQFDKEVRASRASSTHAEELATKTSAKTALLEGKVEASGAQQEALQTLYLELANHRDAWTIAEVEQLLITAGHQLQLAGNVKSALLAMQTANSRLQQIDKPQLLPLRMAIEEDIQRLQAVPSIDIVSMSLKLATLAEAADTLPLMSTRHPVPASATLPDWSTQPWRRLTQEIWHDLKNMIRIERVDQPEAPLLAPEQAYFLRENLRLRLLSARLALLQHDDITYHADLRLIEGWLLRHFDTREAATRAALETLQQLSSGDIVIELPDISASLNAISKYKLALEGGRQ